MENHLIELRDEASGATATVLASLGLNCFSWKPAALGGHPELLWAPEGFESGGARPSSGGTPLLFPFPGRIGGAGFRFQGKDYRLPPGDALGNAIHGFVFNRPWRVVDQRAGSLVAEFRGSVDAPETLEAWPSDYAVRATYTLSATTLRLTFTYSNPGPGDLPCAFGTHAYFRTPMAAGGDAGRVRIAAPVDQQWATRDMLPTGETLSLGPDCPLRDGVTLAGREFDTPFALAPGTAAPVETRVTDPDAGLALVQRCGAEFGCYVIYTPGHRGAVCIEPYTCVPDPFALESRGVASGLAVLPPGASRTHQVDLSVVEM